MALYTAINTARAARRQHPDTISVNTLAGVYWRASLLVHLDGGGEP